MTIYLPILLISHVASLMPPCPSTHPCSSFHLRPWSLLSSFAFSPLLPTITRWWAHAHLHHLLTKRICKITFYTGAILWGLSLIAFFPFPLHLLARFSSTLPPPPSSSPVSFFVALPSVAVPPLGFRIAVALFMQPLVLKWQVGIDMQY